MHTEPDALLGGLAAFVCSGGTIYADIHQAIKKQIGDYVAATPSATWGGSGVVLLWAMISTFLYFQAINHEDWAKTALPFDLTQNLIFAGITIGLGSISIIQSKLLKFGDKEVGLEFVYIRTKSYALSETNKSRAKYRRKHMNRYKGIANNFAKYPKLFEDIEGFINEMSLTYEKEKKEIISGQIDNIKSLYATTYDTETNARHSVIGIAIDYIGHSELDSYCRDNNIT